MISRACNLFLLILLGASTLLKAQKDSTHFVTTWRTSIAGVVGDSSIRINESKLVSNDYTFNYDVDWENDGIFDTLNVTSSSIEHKYQDTGTYTVRIRGEFPVIRFGDYNSNFKRKIISIDQWGSQVWKALDHAFAGCRELNYNATDSPNLDSISNLSGMFQNTSQFNKGLNDWDVSSVINMRGMFSHANSFNQPINNWDVSSVINMRSMFQGARAFNQTLDLWDVSSVIDMKDMFSSASNFNQPLNDWDVSSVTGMSGMFSRAVSFNQPLSNWDVSSVIGMSEMFGHAISFNQSLNNWDVSSVSDMFYMFGAASSFNENISDWDVSSVLIMSGMFVGASSFNQPINDWDVSSVIDMRSLFFYATSFNQSLNDWNPSSTLLMDGMFINASSFNQPLNNWNVSKVTSMSGMFQRASSFNQLLTNWDISSVVDFRSFLDNSGMQRNNYDSLLLSWQAKPRQMNISFGVKNLKYCIGDSARTLLINDGWNFLGDSFDNCLNELQKEVVFSISPNPSTGIFTVSINELPLSMSYYLYDARGRLVGEYLLNRRETSLNLSHLNQGVYFLQIAGKTKKLIISY